MGLRDTLSVLVQIPRLYLLRKELQPRPPGERDCFARQVERNAVRFADRPAVVFEGRTISWAQLNKLANRLARVLRARGIGRGDVVSLLMDNRIEFLATAAAINKIGGVAALINTHLRGRPLSHCIATTHSKACIFGEELMGELDVVREGLGLESGSAYLFVPDRGAAGCPGWAVDLARASEAERGENLPDSRATRLGDIAAYVFTSGTTGLPKASVWSNGRFLAAAGLSHRAGLQCSEKDRLYLCLPLYHGTGLMIGAGAAIASGASIFLRRRFSASAFLDEARENGTTCLVYVGELCRYLTNTPERGNDRHNPLTRAIGNGLRPDIWTEFKQRFGIRRVTEIYGASEGNVSFANVLNKDKTVGVTTREIALVRYDTDADRIVRNATGRCVRVPSGEAGLLLGRITEDAAFEGYTDPEATERKVLRDALEDGDAWFNTGDLLREVDVGYVAGLPHYQFVDRVGDTFRWKSENVSTTEVEEIINDYCQIQLSNVYGVQVAGADGRAGMAALVLAPESANLDLGDFSAFVRQRLPAYARPVFLRVRTGFDLTGTLKMVKGELRKEGYDQRIVKDPLYVMKPGSHVYETLDAAFAARIDAGAAGF